MQVLKTKFMTNGKEGKYHSMSKGKGGRKEKSEFSSKKHSLKTQ